MFNWAWNLLVDGWDWLCFNFEDIFGFLFIIIIIGAIIYGIRLIVLEFKKSAEGRNDAFALCLANGFPELRYANGQYYCYKRENGTDVIVPVVELERAR